MAIKLIRDLAELDKQISELKIQRTKLSNQFVEKYGLRTTANSFTDRKSVKQENEGAKVTFNVSRKWHQPTLDEIFETLTKEEQKMWPFKDTFVEIRADTRAIEKANPKLWKKIEKALTISTGSITVDPIDSED